MLKKPSKVQGFEILYDEDTIKERVAELADRINLDYADKTPLLLIILKGSFIFAADLVRHLNIKHKLEFMTVASYFDNDPHTSGELELRLDLKRNIDGEDVIIVEDIVDTGKTLNYIYHSLQVRQPASLEIVTLLDKKESREVDLSIKYSGFDIPNRFVIGYGLDEAGFFRNLPYIAMKEEER